MAGPTCEVVIAACDGATLDAIDAVLSRAAEQVARTRKGRVWDVWIGGRPVHVSVEGSPPSVQLAAGCNGQEDYDLLKQLAAILASALVGIATEPIK